ncbi:MAG: cupin domain-containing protein [Hymenobacteraceae bacterium]|nr:cupin domain-containing protein [Hymenobacteraceae bacterium]
MKRVSRIIATLIFSSITVASWAGNGPDNGDNCKAAGAQPFSQLLDNHAMRLWEIELQPGQFADVHAHPDHKAYAATDGTLQLTTPDGKTAEIQVKAGDLLWTDATQYKTVNLGAGGFKAVVFEDKTTQQQQPQKYFSLISKK